MKLSLAAALSVVLFLTASCSKKGGDDPVPAEPADMAVLVYAVASNDLYGNLLDDKEEMLQAAQTMDLKGLSWLVYSVTPSSETATIEEITRNQQGECEFRTIKTYDRSVYSTDPARMRRVIDDVAQLRPSASRGLVLWSHGTGFDPASTGSHATATRTDDTLTEPVRQLFSFGADTNKFLDPEYKDRMNIDELAMAIPDGRFDFIWFDACYMSGIETVYQLRNKCNTFVGYPTEVWSPGMPYNITLPYLLKTEPDLKGGAQAFFDYYAKASTQSLRVATVAVIDMSAAPEVAAWCATSWPGSATVPTYGLQCYTRGSVGPFYDFGQVCRSLSPSEADTEAFDRIMDRFVVWKAATPVDFNYRPILPDNYSGLGCHLFSPDVESVKNTYYKSLDWYRDVYAH